MWKIVYNILANLALPIFVLFSLTQKKIRKNLLERFLATTRNANLKDAVWIHAASVGEGAIAENLIRYMRKRGNQEPFLVTTNTYYTKDLLRAKFGENVAVFALPFDLTYTIRHFMARSTFKALLIVETEIWPNLIWEARRRGIPVVIVNARISDRTIRTYKKIKPFLKCILSDVARVVAQSEEHRTRYISIGMDRERTITTGNIKYYRMIARIEENKHDRDAITFGSVKEKELDILLPVIRKMLTTFPNHRLFVAPRELHLTTVIEKELSGSFRVMRYSNYKKDARADINLVVVDTVGDLVGLYAKSSVAFVGGSLAPYGGQNILEPLFFGTPVIFGPYIDNFREIAGLVLQEKAGTMVRTGDELFAAVKKILEDTVLHREMGTAGKRIIEQQGEVMARTVSIIMDVMKQQQYGGCDKGSTHE